MRPIILCAIAWCSLTGATAWGQAQGTPKIQFDRTVYDFGKTSQVQRVGGTFFFTNVGTGVLKLQRPSATCQCTVPNLKKDTLAPGESGELDFTVNVGPYRQMMQKSITVPSNDPQAPQVNLTVKVEYVPVLEVMPQMVYLDNLRLGTVTNTSVQIKRGDGKSLVVSRVQTMDPWLKAKYEPGTNEQSGRVALEVKPVGMARRFYDNVRIFGENTNAPILTFYVSGRAVGDLACQPESLYWTVTGPLLTNFQAVATNPQMSNLITRRLIINSTVPGRAMAITNVTSTIKELETELHPRANKSSYELVARLTTPPQTNASGAIEFDTDVGTQPKVRVPVTINVLRR